MIWFCYLLIVFCIVEIAFNGLPKSSSTSMFNIALEFANPWDLRIQFYPLTILIALPCLPLAYLLTKLFKNDILVSEQQNDQSVNFNELFLRGAYRFYFSLFLFISSVLLFLSSILLFVHQQFEIFSIGYSILSFQVSMPKFSSLIS